MVNSVGSVLVSWDFSNGKANGIVLVGKKKPNEAVEIINAFQGKEAVDIYEKLTIRQGTDA